MNENHIMTMNIDIPGGCRGWVRVSGPIGSSDGDYYCLVCSNMFSRPEYKIYGVDGGQACKLAVEFAIKLIRSIVDPDE